MACTAPLGIVAPAGSRKTVTIVFSDLVGSTALGEALDSEALREVLDRYFTEMRACLERHGGIVEKYIGDAVMAVFGLPRAHEDDAIRALRAAADMRISLTRLNHELEDHWGVTLTNRSGVYTGEVVTGDPATGQRLVTGDAVNTAARLEQAAPHGEVLIGEQTVGLAMGGVQVEAVDPVIAKGKAEPLPAYRLVSVTNGGPKHHRTDVAMVGRGSELNALLEAFDRACRDRVCVLTTVIADAGVGKTKLVEELISRIGDRAVIAEGRCLSYGEGITYWPLSQIVRQLAGIGESDPRDLALRKLGSLCEGATDPDGIVERVATAMGLVTSPIPKEELAWGFRKLLEHLGVDRPLAVVFDDIHWAERSLLDAIVHVATLARATPLFLVCMARPELEEDSPGWADDVLEHVAVRLGALSENESESMVAGLIGGLGMPEDTLSDVVAAAGGNPLFLEQMLSLWQDDGTLVLGSSGWELAIRSEGLSIPPSIHALLAARLDSLGEQERAVLERGAVVGQVFPLGAVEAMSSDPVRPGIGAALATLEGRNLIRGDDDAILEDPAYAFVHLLVRDATYAGMLKRLRAELHERFADWLLVRAGDRLPELEEIVGYHLEQSFRNLLELGPADERTTRLAADAATHLVASGQRAAQRGEAAAAANLLGRAGELIAEGEPRRAGVLYDLARALMDIPRLTEAHDALVAAKEAATSVGDEGTEWRSRLTLASARSLMDPHALTMGKFRAQVEEAIEVFERLEDDRGLATGWFHLAEIEWMECRYGSAVRSIDRAIAHTERSGEHDPMLIGFRIVALLHGPVPVRECLREYEAIAAGQTIAIVEAVVHAVRGSCLAMLGDVAVGRDELARAATIVEDMGQPGVIAGVKELQGWLEVGAGDASAAERAFRDAYGTTGVDDMGHLSTNAAYLALALQMLGRLDEAEQYALESRRLAAEEDVASQVGARIAMAKVSAALGNLDNAESEARDAIQIADGSEWPNGRGDARMALAEALRLAGKRGEAATCAEGAFAVYEQKGNIVSMNGARVFVDEMATMGGP